MTARFTTLASGSGGNSSLLEVDGFGLLIDCGLHPRTLSARLAAIGSSWDAVHAVILTHTHSDHWKDLTLARLRTGRIALYGHEGHLGYLNSAAASFEPLHSARLAIPYSEGQSLNLAPGLVCRPIRVSHDSEPTCAFRFDHLDGAGRAAWSLGYAADLGCVTEGLAEAFAGVDVLALEYNHDVRMQRTSSRPAFLIERVLSDRGHLSNQQAGDLTQRIAKRSATEVPWCLVQLHLSRECNTPELAAHAGREAFGQVSRRGIVVTATQNAPSRSIPLDRRPDAKVHLERPISVGISGAAHVARPSLPGFES